MERDEFIPDSTDIFAFDRLSPNETGYAWGRHGRDNSLISLVIPAYNEELNIDNMERAILNVTDKLPYSFEFIVIDNCSTDSTPHLLRKLCERDPRWKYIRFSRNFLVESSISAGYRHASGDAIIVLYSDLQEPPELIPQFLAKWREGYDVVYGVHKRREGERAHLTFIVKIAYRIVSYLSDDVIPPDSGDFRLISKRVRNILESCDEYHRYTRGLIPWLGFRQIGVAYERQARVAGTSKSPLSIYLRYFMNAITGFSMKPLRMFFPISAITFVVGLLCLISATAIALAPETVAAGNNISAALFVLSVVFSIISFNSLGFFVLGEYLGRTYLEVRKRPRFIIDERVNFSRDVLEAEEEFARVQDAAQ